MKKKGFTLIELLAVIIILAVIALITIPRVMDTIDDSKKGALKDTASNILDSAIVYQAKDTMLNGGKLSTVLITDLKNDTTLEYKGTRPDGKVLVTEKDKSAIVAWDGSHCAVKTFSDSAVSIHDEIRSKEECLNQELRPMNVLQSGLYLGIYNSVSFVNYLPEDTTSARDVSEAKDGSILLWVDESNNAYIGSEKVIAANPDSSWLFSKDDYSGLTATDEMTGVITSIQFNNWFDTSKVTNMSFMFNLCKNLTSLDVSGFDTSNVTNMRQLFCFDELLTFLDVSHFDTSKVTDMHGMFYQCSGLTSLDIGHFDTSKVTDMFAMFYKCFGLTSLDVSHFNVSEVTDMAGMFAYCSKLTSLDVSHFDTSKVTTMYLTFYNCSSLLSLDVSNFDTSNVENMSIIFGGCSSLTSLDVSHFDTSKVTTMRSMFWSCSSLTSLDVSHFDTSNVENMYSMFYNCSSLTSLDVSHFDTSNVENMFGIFSANMNTSSPTIMNLREIKGIENFNTSKVTNMGQMFANCIYLTSLDVSNFDTSKVTDMTLMFGGYKHEMHLQEIKGLENFDTSNVTSMRGMFQECTQLQSLDLSSFNTSKVTDMAYMFHTCNNAKTIYVSSNFVTTAVTTSSYMFYKCYSLVGGSGTAYNSSNITATYAHIDGGTSNPGYFTEKS